MTDLDGLNAVKDIQKVAIVCGKSGTPAWKTTDNLKGETAKLEDAEGVIVACRDL